MRCVADFEVQGVKIKPTPFDNDRGFPSGPIAFSAFEGVTYRKLRVKQPQVNRIPKHLHCILSDEHFSSRS